MNSKGVTLVELIVVIAVISVISVFTVASVGAVLDNSKNKTFVNTGEVMLDSAESAFHQEDSLWSDGKATLGELVAGGFLTLDEKGPWGGDYDLDESYVIIEDDTFKGQIVCTNASLGVDGLLTTFDVDGILYVTGGGGSVIDGIVETITGSVSTSITGDEGNDLITISGSARGSAVVSTLGGDDTVEISSSLLYRASINTGEGNDSISVGSKMKGSTKIFTEEGNDTVDVGGMVNKASINTGSGNDVLNVNSMSKNTKIDTGSDDDIVFVNIISRNYMGSVNLGAGDDILKINDSDDLFLRVRGSFIGGSGEDTLELPYVSESRWNEISSLFSGFETIKLKDTTIYN